MRVRVPPPLAELGRFLAVGGVATVVALFWFNLLVHGFRSGAQAPLAHQPILGYVLANAVGMVVSYHGSRRWAFRDRPSRHADGGLSAFVAINLLTMLIPIACLVVSRDLLGLDDPVSDNVAANVIGLALGLTARFVLFRALVFRRPIHLGELYDEPGACGALRVVPGGLSAGCAPGEPSATTGSTDDLDVPSAPAAAAG